MEDKGKYSIDDVCYEDLESYIMTGIFGFCGCTGIETLILIDKTLEHFDNYQDKNTYWEDLVRDIFGGNEGATYITANLLDNKGLIEHGIAIRGSWLTDKGKEIWIDIKKIIEDNKKTSDYMLIGGTKNRSGSSATQGNSV